MTEPEADLLVTARAFRAAEAAWKAGDHGTDEAVQRCIVMGNAKAEMDAAVETFIDDLLARHQ